tara:strand:+ start:204583 stop:205359 length:777 start_codon:yes stop_codon:yes gene_type:complete
MKKFIVSVVVFVFLVMATIIISHGTPLNTKKIQMQRGTAWAINDQGYWITARHSVIGCHDDILLETTNNVLSGRIAFDPVRGMRVLSSAKVIYTHPDYDLALIKGASVNTPVYLRSDIEPAIKVGKKGYVIGYPGGVDGYIEVVFEGRETTIRRDDQDEPVYEWKVVSTHLQNGRVGGISGAPVVDENNQILGVMTAQSGRLKSILASKPVSIQDLVGSQGHSAGEVNTNDNQSPRDISNYLLERKSISKLYCSKDFR